MNENREILIEMRADMKHVRERIDHLATNDEKQWAKLEAQGQKLEGHDKTLYFLSKGFWGAISGITALAIAWFKGNK